jgi:hypothetical protein
MDVSEIAKTLGRRGGRARSARLSAADKRRIAAMGGHARRQSLQAARRIADNFRYVSAVDALRARTATVKRVRTMSEPLPGIYPPRT